MALDFNPSAHCGDSVAIEHAHTMRGRAGNIRVLGFRNYERMGAFAEAIDSAPGGTPTMSNVCRNQTKYGFGIAAEQSFHPDGGVFLHGSWNDGRTETYSFAEIERSLAARATMKGPLWHRPGDSLGVAWLINGLSSEHRDYLARGGVGFLIGDGQLTRYKPEQILEAYYAIATFPGLWLSVDFQHIANPAYNAIVVQRSSLVCDCISNSRGGPDPCRSHREPTSQLDGVLHRACLNAPRASRTAVGLDHVSLPVAVDPGPEPVSERQKPLVRGSQRADF
jgi:carbohydrate-selective porin OprB